MRDYYAILELSLTASQDMIREQYRFLIQAWHPDKFSNPKQKEKAEERTKLINEAYSVLNNPKKRAQYDSVRSTQSSSFRQEQKRQQAEETKSCTEYEQQQRKKADEERQRKQAEETKRRTEYEQQQRKKADEERLRKQAKETKSRTEYEQQQRKKADEERQRKQDNALRIAAPAFLIGLGIVLLVHLVVGFISNQHPSSETQQVTSGNITPKPTPSLTFFSTQVSPTITLSPTPDKRLILVEPKELLLEKADLPPEAMYILPGPEWISPQHNSETISEWGVEKGSKFVEETGRVDGWWVIYLRSNKEVRAPEQIKDSITMYKTIEGAQLVINTFYINRGLELGYTELDNPIRIGDISYALVYKGMQSNGKYGVEIEIFFSYRNYVHVVGGLGGEDDVTIGYVDEITKILLRKLQAAPLSNP